MDHIIQSRGKSAEFLWAVAVFATRERPQELLTTIDAIIRAACERTAVDVMVNGNPQLAAEIAALIESRNLQDRHVVIRVWSLRLADKANAWNQYVHFVCRSAKLSFFVDGYVCVQDDAFSLLQTGMCADPQVLGGTGVPTTGKSAKSARSRMLLDGGMHGNLFALKEDVMKQLRQRKFNLPLGIYRNDSTLGAALAFGLDPARHEWNLKGRILVHPRVSWATDERKWWRYKDIKSHFKRLLRQAQGALENSAVRNHLAIQRLAPEMLPRTAAELVTEWVKSCPGDARNILWRTPLARFALRGFRQSRDWSAAEQAPELILTA
jgi:hypothetical protein